MLKLYRLNALKKYGHRNFGQNKIIILPHFSYINGGDNNMNNKKHFPADTSLDYETFLNDSKVDGELYAYLLSQSYGDKKSGETVVYKANLPSQEK